MQTLRLTNADELPGHEMGRQRLQARIAEWDHDAIEVRGEYEHDVFVVTDVRGWDADTDQWGDWTSMGSA